MCLGEWENEEGDYVAYVRTAESEKEAAVRLFLLSVRSGLEGGAGLITGRNEHAHWQCHSASRYSPLPCVWCGLAVAWCNLTHLTCACGRPGCRTGLRTGPGPIWQETHCRGSLIRAKVSLWTSCLDDAEDFLIALLSILPSSSRVFARVAEIRELLRSENSATSVFLDSQSSLFFYPERRIFFLSFSFFRSCAQQLFAAQPWRW